MKKLLFVLLVGFGAAMMVKNGQVTVTPDRQVMVAGYHVPLPEAVQNSPVFGMVTEQLPQASSRAAGSPVAPARPALPIVSSASGSFDANASGNASGQHAGPVTGAAGFSAAAKVLRGSQ
jgi:hypothetical protein